MIDDMHKAKIDMADVVYFLIKDGYMGESVANELNYAREKNKEYMIREIID